MQKAISQYHVAVAAEAFAAGLFAQAGFDVSVQYGANQPGYDLVVGSDGKLMTVSVKGSQDGAWGLLQNYKAGVDYHEAAELWLRSQQKSVVFCLVQFEGVSLGQCPRTYLARPSEIADYLKKSKNGNGYSKLYEERTYKKGVGLGSTDKIPESWKFSTERVEELLGSR
jgi:hypothetical protein